MFSETTDPTTFTLSLDLCFRLMDVIRSYPGLYIF